MKSTDSGKKNLKEKSDWYLNMEKLEKEDILFMYQLVLRDNESLKMKEEINLDMIVKLGKELGQNKEGKRNREKFEEKFIELIVAKSKIRRLERELEKERIKRKEAEDKILKS